jgi:hypothetical protein
MQYIYVHYESMIFSMYFAENIGLVRIEIIWNFSPDQIHWKMENLRSHLPIEKELMINRFHYSVIKPLIDHYSHCLRLSNIRLVSILFN